MKTITDSDILICGHGSGTPSTKNLHTYSDLRHAQKARNGVRKGIVEVRRHILITDKHRPNFVSSYKTLIGRNRYSQPWRQYVYTKRPEDGKYYSDCSSSGMATYKKIGLDTGGLLNTAGIHSSSKFTTVEVTIKNGHIMDPWKLEIGDCILFAGSDPSRPKQIGHVEYVYKMPGSKCSVKRKSYIYAKADQTAKHLAALLSGDTVRVFEDCKNGWSMCTDGKHLGYIKNTNIEKVGKSSYPIGTIADPCWMYANNSKTSKKILKLDPDPYHPISVKIITMHKYYTYISATVNGVAVKGWVGTKHISYK